MLPFHLQLTFSSTVSMDERLVYSPDPSNNENTVLRQETIITVKGVPLTSYMENYLLNSISNNSFKVCDGSGVVVVETVLTSFTFFIVAVSFLLSLLSFPYFFSPFPYSLTLPY